MENKLLPVLALLAFGSVSSHAVVTDQQLWHFNGDLGNSVAGGVALADGGSIGAGYLQYNGGNPASSSSGQYLSFSGSSSSAFSGLYQSSGSFALADDHFGVEFWIRTDTPEQTGAKTIFRSSNTGNNGALSIKYNDGGTGGISISSDGRDYVGAPCFLSLADQAWHSLAVVALGDITKVYWDGVEVFSGTTGYYGGNITSFNTTGSALASNFHIGVAPGGTSGFFNGDIDELRYFTFANGAFNPLTDLTIPIPESSTYALAGGIIALGAALVFRRRRIC